MTIRGDHSAERSTACRLCGGEAIGIQALTILGAHQTRLDRCSRCDLIQTGEPVWLAEAYATAMRLLTEHRPLLDRIAAALLERETIDREDLDLLARNLPLPPRSAPPTAVPASPEKGRVESAGIRPPLLGAPPAEPAGA